MKVEYLKSLLRNAGDEPDRIQQLRKLIVALEVSGKLGINKRSHDFPSVSPDALPAHFEETSGFTVLGAVARIEKGRTGIKQAVPGAYPLVVTAAERSPCDHFDFEGPAAIVPLVSSTGHGKASLHRLHYQEGQFALGTILAAIFPLDPSLISARFIFEYLSAFKEELLVSRMIGTANVSLSVGKIAEVPVPLVGIDVQAKVDELMALCDQLEAARTEREATRDRLAAASLARLNAPDPETFAADARFAIHALPSLTARTDRIKRLRQTILNLAVRGKLVLQQSSDEPVVALLERFSKAKLRRKADTGDSRIKVAKNPSSDQLDIDLPPGWGIQSFENLFLFIDYRGNTPPKTPHGIPLITAKNIRKGFLDREPREFISEATFRAWMTRGLPKIGDLFFTTEAPLANVCVNELEEPFALAQRSICLQPYSEVNTRFLMMTILSDVMQLLIEKHATGMTAKGIKAANLKPLPLPIPPLAEQHRIVAKVDELMAVCDKLEASIASADDTRRRLLDALLAEALQPAFQAAA